MIVVTDIDRLNASVAGFQAHGEFGRARWVLIFQQYVAPAGTRAISNARTLECKYSRAKPKMENFVRLNFAAAPGVSSSSSSETQYFGCLLIVAKVGGPSSSRSSSPSSPCSSHHPTSTSSGSRPGPSTTKWVPGPRRPESSHMFVPKPALWLQLMRFRSVWKPLASLERDDDYHRE